LKGRGGNFRVYVPGGKKKKGLGRGPSPHAKKVRGKKLVTAKPCRTKRGALTLENKKTIIDKEAAVTN